MQTIIHPNDERITGFAIAFGKTNRLLIALRVITLE